MWTKGARPLSCNEGGRGSEATAGDAQGGRVAPARGGNVRRTKGARTMQTIKTYPQRLSPSSTAA